MTYDFSNHNSSKKKPKKSRVSPTKPQTPGWVWMLIGLLLGGAIVLFYPKEVTQTSLTEEELSIDATHATKVEVATEVETLPQDSTKEIQSITEEVITETVTTPTKFEFYTILSEQEVMVQELQRPTLKDKQSDRQSTLIKKQILKKNRDYILQAGSFQKEKDALRLVAKITSLGLKVKIEKNKIQRNDSFSVWHRVMVGPLSKHDDIYKAETLLNKQGIKTLLMQRKQ